MATLEDNPAGWQYDADKCDPAFIDGAANFAVIVLSELLTYGLSVAGLLIGFIGMVTMVRVERAKQKLRPIQVNPLTEHNEVD